MNMIIACQKRTSFLENFKIRAVIKKTIIELKKILKLKLSQKLHSQKKLRKLLNWISKLKNLMGNWKSR